MQTYLNTLHKRNEITLEDKNLMRPKFAQIGHAHDLPKIHKDYLSSLLNSLTTNNYYVEDTFEAAKCIKAIPPKLFSEGYKFICFNVTSLFTNVLLKRTVNIILK